MKRPSPVVDGLSWPVTGQGEDGEPLRSTQETGKNILAAALAAVDEEAAQKVRSERGWRFKYKKHFVKSVEVSAATPSAALKVAKAGLDYMYDHFEFLRDGKRYVLREALNELTGSFATGHIQGSKPKPAHFELEVPYMGKVLKGDELHKQLDKWVRGGVIELSCGASIGQVARSSPWLDLSDRHFVLLGAGAAMGPLQVLLALGANVIAVDLNREEIWKRLIELAEQSCGSLTFPLRAGTKQEELAPNELFTAAGCNLFTQTPEIKNWLLTVYPGKQLCVGGYAYIPGDLFPRVALAMDVIIKELSEKRNAAVAFLCTPTDCHLIPAEAHAACKDNFRKAPWWQKLLGMISLGKWCVKNARRPICTAAGETLYMVDALVVAQGPNYALAKRMQHWRAMVAREMGCIISSNIAPSTRTASVLQNKNFAYAFETMHTFRPYELPGPETSNAVMTALLIHDINQPMHAGTYAMPLINPQQIFSQGAFHGGTWRCGFTFESIGVPAVLLYYMQALVVKNYLILYNIVQTVAWLYMLLLSLSHLAYPQAASPWEAFGTILYLAQNFALLEVVHAFVKMVRAPWTTTLLQLTSRVICVHVVSSLGALHAHGGLVVVSLAWGVTEVIRYSWYAMNLIGKPLSAHTWLRYSTFIVLYPLGVAGELSIFWTSIPMLEAPLMIGVSAGWLLKFIIMPGYIPGLPILYLYLLAQRAKVLGTTTKKKGE